MPGHQLQGLKAFVISHPPLVVFTVCFFLFGVTTVLLAFIVGRSDLPNPDITMDWNVFFTHLTQRDLCVHSMNISEHRRIAAMKKVNRVIKTENVNSTGNITAVSTPEPLIGVEQLSLSELLPDISSLKLGNTQTGPSFNVTKSMIVPLSFDAGLLQLPTSVTWLRGHVTGRLVGYTGQQSKEIIHVNMFLPNNLKSKTTHCRKDPACKIDLNVCVVFFGPTTVIPKTKQFQGCRHWTDDVRHAANTTWFLPEYVPNRCTGKVNLKLHYKNNPHLTAMLGSFDKSVVNLHLLNTSYLIFFIVITLICYALVRSHFMSPKLLLYKKVNV